MQNLILYPMLKCSLEAYTTMQLIMLLLNVSSLEINILHTCICHRLHPYLWFCPPLS